MQAMESGARGPDRAVALQREQVLRQLSEACLDGRITPGDLASRAAAAQAARTTAELRCLTWDLPASGAVTDRSHPDSPL